MLRILTASFNAVFPLCALIAFGYILKTIGFLNENFTKEGNKLAFKFLIPIMIFNNVYKVNSIADINWGVALFCMAVIFVVFGIGLAVTPLITPDNRRRGVVLQNFFRSNTTVIGIPLADALGGSAAVAVASVVGAFCIPLLNILGVVALTLYVGDNGKKPSMKSTLMKIAKNPLIDAIALALLCLVIRYFEIQFFGSAVFTLNGTLKFLYTPLTQLASIASPLALLLLGTQFDLGSVGDMKKEIILCSFCRLLLVPVIAIAAAIASSALFPGLHFGPAEYPTIIGNFATPAAVTGVVMAAQMDNDEQLAAQVVVWTSLGSIVTLFLLVACMIALGLLHIA